MPIYSDGSFSRVFFWVDRDGLDTFTYRNHRVEPARTQLNTLISSSSNRFVDVFVRTSLLHAA